MRLPKMTEFAHDLIKRVVGVGDHVIDATVGNGHDTLFLAKCVGKTGHVFGFDIQESAIEHTKEQLIQEGDIEQVTLIHDSHEKMKEYVKEGIQVILFNLGYLPGGDKKITTQIKSTLPAIDASLDLLKVGGLLVLVVYPGHEQGREESDQILPWAEKLDSAAFQVLRIDYLNQPHNPPYILSIHRRKYNNFR